MVASSILDPTACNMYANEDKEFIFCVKGRPFGCLLSPHLPTPTSSLIDYNLVRDLGIKMTDLQYTKFAYYGNKLRILGKVCFTAQTIHEGLASGSIPFKANMILDLSKPLEVDTVAGVKLQRRLTGSDVDQDSNCTSSGALSTGCQSPSGTPVSSLTRLPLLPERHTLSHPLRQVFLNNCSIVMWSSTQKLRYQ